MTLIRRCTMRLCQHGARWRYSKANSGRTHGACGFVSRSSKWLKPLRSHAENPYPASFLEREGAAIELVCVLVQITNEKISSALPYPSTLPSAPGRVVAVGILPHRFVTSRESSRPRLSLALADRSRLSAYVSDIPAQWIHLKHARSQPWKQGKPRPRCFRMMG